jgi:hypothetical protein
MHGPASVRPSGHPGIPVASEWQYIGREPLLAAYRTSFVLWRMDAMALAEDPPFGGLWCDQPAPFYAPDGANALGESRKRDPPRCSGARRAGKNPSLDACEELLVRR